MRMLWADGHVFSRTQAVAPMTLGMTTTAPSCMASTDAGTRRTSPARRSFARALPLAIVGTQLLLIALAGSPTEAATRPHGDDTGIRRISNHVRQAKKQKKPKWRETGEASYYGREFAHRRTANGERFDPSLLTAAHRSLPFGTRLRVTNLENGRRVVVRINDRGPYAKGRVLDLSRAAARRLGFVRDGVTQVRMEVLRDAHSWRDPLAAGAVSRSRASGRSPGAAPSTRRPTTRKGSTARV